MDHLVTSLCLAGALGAGLVPAAAAASNAQTHIPTPVATQMKAHQISSGDLSFYVHKLSEAEPRIALNADVPRNPASTVKLLTTLAGLSMLGPTYSWRTVAYISGSVSNGRLQGDLIIKGFADPNLTLEGLWRLLWGVRERGIETIGGDLVLDSSYLELSDASRGDFDGKPGQAYNALPSALSVNSQTTQVYLRHDEPEGRVRVFTDPPLANVTLDNQLQVVNAPCKRRYHKPRLRLIQEGLKATLRLTGTVADGCGESSYPSLMLEPAAHAAGAIVELWRGMGGRIEGAVRQGTVPPEARQLYTLSSQPLENVIRLINKRSDNLMARTLFLTLGANRLGAPGSLPKARQATYEWLKASGLDLPELVLDNGSGLSRQTRIAARSLGRVLGFAFFGPTMPEFLSSLAVAGVDGTVRKRFRNSPLKGNAHLKTGTVRGSSAIAGIVKDRDGERWIAVSIANNPKLQAWRAKAVENALLQWVHDGAGEGGAGRSKRSGNGLVGRGARAKAEARLWFLDPPSPVRLGANAESRQVK